MRVPGTNPAESAGTTSGTPAPGLLRAIYALATGDASATSLDDWRHGAMAREILRAWADRQDGGGQAAVCVGWQEADGSCPCVIEFAEDAAPPPPSAVEVVVEEPAPPVGFQWSSFEDVYAHFWSDEDNLPSAPPPAPPPEDDAAAKDETPASVELWWRDSLVSILSVIEGAGFVEPRTTDPYVVEQLVVDALRRRGLGEG